MGKYTLSRPQRLVFDDQLSATLRDLGQATTGEVREALGDIMLTFENRGLECTCSCGEVSHRRHRSWTTKPYASDVRGGLRRLARSGRCIELPTATPNNHGGHLWLWTGDANA